MMNGVCVCVCVCVCMCVCVWACGRASRKTLRYVARHIYPFTFMNEDNLIRSLHKLHIVLT